MLVPGTVLALISLVAMATKVPTVPAPMRGLAHLSGVTGFLVGSALIIASAFHHT